MRGIERHFRLDFRERTQGERKIISEYYQLRRSAIKDISSYLGFLVGFIGSAPFAWGLLAVQLDAGRFARGLWYFFGIVTTAGIFSGIAGLGIGVAAGVVWEQVHRHRRARRQTQMGAPETPGAPGRNSANAVDEGAATPRLQLIAPAPPALPNLAGRRISAARFTANAVELDFGGHRISIAGSIMVVSGTTRHAYPDPGSRDAICAVIGSRVLNVRAFSGDRVEVVLDRAASLVIPRNARADFDEPPRSINEY